MVLTLEEEGVFIKIEISAGPANRPHQNGQWAEKTKKWFKFRSEGAEMLGAEGQAGPRRLEYDLEAGEEAHPSPKRGPAVSPAGLTKPFG